MAKHRTLILFIIALALGLGAAALANRWIQSHLAPAASAEPATTPVVVAALEIPFGHKVEAAQVKTIPWPNGNVPEGVFHDPGEVTGKIAKQKILKGELLLRDRIADHTSGSTLAAIISPEKRAVTVRVNDVIGVAGFLLPGNRVDVLASRKQHNRRAETRVLLEDLKVLAVDQTASPEKDKPVVVRAVTLEMTPKEAEKLVQATEEGSVQLALRNPLDESRVAKTKEVKPAPRKVASVRRRAPSVSSVTVIRGTSVDVSKVRL
jgi:pilus assembly protein CpaB